MTNPRQRYGLAAHFGPLELAILEVLWAGGEMDVAECCKHLAGDQAYTTVKTVLERLVVKNHLGRRKESRAYLYWPSRSRDEVEAGLAAASAQQLISGFGSLAVSNFVDTVKSDPDRLAQLMSLLGSVPNDETR